MGFVFICSRRFRRRNPLWSELSGGCCEWICRRSPSSPRCSLDGGTTPLPPLRLSATPSSVISTPRCKFKQIQLVYDMNICVISVEDTFCFITSVLCDLFLPFKMKMFTILKPNFFCKDSQSSAV